MAKSGGKLKGGSLDFVKRIIYDFFMTSLHYPGLELSLFEKAHNYHRYLAAKLIPYLKGRILEVGAGRGDRTPYLLNKEIGYWLCLEPDPGHLQSLKEKRERGNFPPSVDFFPGTLQDLAAAKGPLPGFDGLLYLDVLEHIEEDRAEALLAASFLAPGGYLIVLSPAHPFLYSPFDRHVGHFRRYRREELTKLMDPTLFQEIQVSYLDGLGFFASLLNKLLLKKEIPTEEDILFWDKGLVPLSRFFDPLWNRWLGKSLLGVWRKRNG